jgi:hypothetical protein
MPEDPPPIPKKGKRAPIRTSIALLYWLREAYDDPSLTNKHLSYFQWKYDCLAPLLRAGERIEHTLWTRRRLLYPTYTQEAERYTIVALINAYSIVKKHAVERSPSVNRQLDGALRALSTLVLVEGNNTGIDVENLWPWIRENFEEPEEPIAHITACIEKMRIDVARTFNL